MIPSNRKDLLQYKSADFHQRGRDRLTTGFLRPPPLTHRWVQEPFFKNSADPETSPNISSEFVNLNARRPDLDSDFLVCAGEDGQGEAGGPPGGRLSALEQRRVCSKRRPFRLLRHPGHLRLPGEPAHLSGLKRTCHTVRLQGCFIRLFTL